MTFTVFGDPRGKARPRVAYGASGAHAYTPKPTADAERAIRDTYTARFGSHCVETGPVRLEIVAYYRIPARTPKRERDEMILGNLHPTKRPDADNVAKLVLDALNGAAYRDDAQITELAISKRYAIAPRLVITVQPIGGTQA